MTDKLETKEPYKPIEPLKRYGGGDCGTGQYNLTQIGDAVNAIITRINKMEEK